MKSKKKKYILPDSLRRGLKVVFVGTAAGRRSAEERAYYAHPGNKFWRTLQNVGLTKRLLLPSDFRQGLKEGLGFTDMCKTQSGGDHEISGYDPKTFGRKIEQLRPAIVAFTSKKAASEWMRKPTRTIKYGKQSNSSWSSTEIFVLPSPSGAAAKYWDERYWKALARSIKR